MISPRHSGMPALNAEACPPFSLRSSRTCGSNLRTISGVRSVEPSSTTRISRSEAGKSCSSTLTIASSMKRSWLYVSIRTLTKSFPKSPAQLLVAAAALAFAGIATRFFSEEEAIHSLRFLRASSNRCR